MKKLKGKRVLLGITGGIAAYKGAELARLLIKEGAQVQVVMTEAATRFISPLTLSVLTGNSVATDMFTGEVNHINLAREADLLIIAPLTAHTAARLTLGLADDLLSALFLAFRGPVILAPAMNSNMLSHPAVQDNLKVLKQRGAEIVEPDTGYLACGAEGKGRLVSPELLLETARRQLRKRDLAGKKVLVSAGPTREPLDPVRCITNYSSGKMGYALAGEAASRGAETVLVSGPTCLQPPPGVRLERVETALEMKAAIEKHFPLLDALVMAAAVSDYRPRQRLLQKQKKDEGELQLVLQRNPDILAELGKQKQNQILVGFAAETENLLENAQTKLKQKNLDLIVANDVSLPDSGFGCDTNKAALIDANGAERMPLMTKTELAHLIWDRVVQLLAK